MAPSLPASSVVRYYLYKATKAVEFYRPVMYLYFLSQGLTFTQIAALEAVYNLTTVVGEVPTGYVGDRVGRRNSLLLGTSVIAATLVGLGFAETFPAFLGLYALWSLGYTFRSGSEDAWLYDTLTVELSEDAFARVRGRGESMALLVGVVGAVVGGYLGSVDLRYPFWVAAGLTAVGIPVLLSMPEPESVEGAGGDVLSVRRALGIIRGALTRRRLRAFVLYYYVLFAAVLYLVFIFVQPIFETVTLDLGLAQAQVEQALGWYYAGISLVGAALSYNAGAIEEHVGLRTWFLVLPLGVGAALGAMWAVPVLALPVLLLVRGVADTTATLASQYVNDRIESTGRATVLSAMAMVSAVTVVPFQLGSGVLSDAVSPLFALAVAGGVLAVGSVVVWLWEAPIASA
ncbi:MFS transporter [Haloarchaeobius sp. HME9146]|uniref:MFS transporter n=1 Tax=Haloarchaeobius sp. HME9146 TaxID=2978732 RepID=UPI0021BE2A79|nr:MFS transporter [Haloarchaeobius sp. HME9146]MCT9095551.1 MFS transporter [Haloarchaeobius sp. HME9146]